MVGAVFQTMSGDRNQKWLPNRCPIGGPKLGNGCIALAFSGVPKAQRGEQNQKWGGTIVTPRLAEVGLSKKRSPGGCP